MQRKRPVNLNLWTIRFPITAISSILHRASGVFLLLFIGLLLYGLQLSLASEASFIQLQSFLSQGAMRFFIWLFLSSLIFHAIAGIRHLLMDLGYGEGKVSGSLGAYATLILSALLIFALGIRLW